MHTFLLRPLALATLLLTQPLYAAESAPTTQLAQAQAEIDAANDAALQAIGQGHVTTHFVAVLSGADQTNCAEAISATAPNLLVEPINVLGQCCMYHGTNVALINP